jgi:hypothetical protein
MEVTPYITEKDTCLSPLVYVPSDDAEILAFELFTGQLIARLKGMEKDSTGRVTCITGRPGHQELYSGAVDAEIGVWESGLVYRPAVAAGVAEERLKGQEMLRDIYKAFAGQEGAL